MKIDKVLALDVGEKRVGLAVGDSSLKIAVPFGAVDNDDQLNFKLAEIIGSEKITKLVVGLPRNSKGEETKQSAYARRFAEKLSSFDLPIIFQDESLTSVEAEQTLLKLNPKKSRRDFGGQVDARAAALILSDFLETNYGRL